MLKEANAKILEDILSLLKQLSNEEFSEHLEIINHKTIGDHIRHIIEFYQCLLDINENTISYDARKRNPEIAENKRNASVLIKKIKSDLALLNLCTELSLEQYLNNHRLLTTTNVERELLYNLEHAIHHLAIIKIAINNKFPNIQLDPSFGVAFSTLAYEKSNC